MLRNVRRSVLPIAAAVVFQYGCSSVPPTTAARPEVSAAPTIREGPEYRLLWLAAKPGGKLYSVILEHLPKGAKFLFRRSDDYGVNWQDPPTALVEAKEPGVMVNFPWMEIDGKDGVYVVWRWKRAGSKAIYFNRSLDGGRTWQDQPLMLTDKGQPFPPALHVDPDGRLFVLWQDEERKTRDLSLTVSLDSGSTWLKEPIRLTAHLPGITQVYDRKLTSDSTGRVYVAWYEREMKGSFPRRLVLNRSADLGTSWLAEPQTIRGYSEPLAPGIYQPVVVAGRGAHLYIAWQERDRTGWRLLFTRSTDGGVTWAGEPFLLSAHEPPQGLPQKLRLATDGKGTLYALWTEVVTDDREWLMFRRSTDFGATWGPARRLEGDTPPGAFSDTPWIAADGDGHVFVAWQHWERRTWRGWRILFTRSEDSGATWLPAPIRLDTLPPQSPHPRPLQLATDGRGALYVAWRGDPFGKPDYFLNRSMDRGATWLPKEAWLTNPSALQPRRAEAPTSRR